MMPRWRGFASLLCVTCPQASSHLANMALLGLIALGLQTCLHGSACTRCVAGLEVRVAFGGVWKESLTELSGGQRSLLALSLILAMLLFKPAPIYILDEARSIARIRLLSCRMLSVGSLSCLALLCAAIQIVAHTTFCNSSAGNNAGQSLSMSLWSVCESSCV